MTLNTLTAEKTVTKVVPAAKTARKPASSAPKAVFEKASTLATCQSPVAPYTMSQLNANTLFQLLNLYKAEERSKQSKEPNPTKTKRQKVGSAINSPSSQKLDVFVFGSGESGELGLGPKAIAGKRPTHVHRPRLNKLLDNKHRWCRSCCSGRYALRILDSRSENFNVGC